VSGLFESVSVWLLALTFNSPWMVLFYGLPLLLCAYGYTARTWRNYRKDVAKCGNEFYSPTDTIGTLIGRGVCTVTPLANLLAAIFDLGPEVFGSFFRWIGRVFDAPLVPGRKKDPPVPDWQSAMSSREPRR
jgi:hypothetical protein